MSEHHSAILAKYGLFVTAVLDHMEGMLMGQVRKVMSILARLAWKVRGNGGGGVIQDNLNIVIKKQINSIYVALEHMGVVGTTDDEDMGQPVAESSRKTSVVLEMVGEVRDTLESVEMRTRNWPDVAGLFQDKLSNMVGENIGLDSTFK